MGKSRRRGSGGVKFTPTFRIKKVNSVRPRKERGQTAHEVNLFLIRKRPFSNFKESVHRSSLFFFFFTTLKNLSRNPHSTSPSFKKGFNSMPRFPKKYIPAKFKHKFSLSMFSSRGYVSSIRVQFLFIGIK